MLFNLVKLRYGDAPVFLDVASVINQYLVEGAVGFLATGPRIPSSRGRTRRSITGSVREGVRRETHNDVFAHQRRKVRPQSHDSNPACGHTQFFCRGDIR